MQPRDSCGSDVDPTGELGERERERQSEVNLRRILLQPQQLRQAVADRRRGHSARHLPAGECRVGLEDVGEALRVGGASGRGSGVQASLPHAGKEGAALAGIWPAAQQACARCKPSDSRVHLRKLDRLGGHRGPPVRREGREERERSRRKAGVLAVAAWLACRAPPQHSSGKPRCSLSSPAVRAKQRRRARLRGGLQPLHVA